MISYCYIISLNWHVTINGDSTAAVLTITTVNLVNTDTEGGVESVEINGGGGGGVRIKLVEFRENVLSFFPWGHSKLSVIMRFPY